jgi:hypothetical protein
VVARTKDVFKGLGCNEGDGEPFFRIQLVDVVSQVTTDWKGYSFEETKLDVKHYGVHIQSLPTMCSTNTPLLFTA